MNRLFKKLFRTGMFIWLIILLVGNSACSSKRDEVKFCADGEFAQKIQEEIAGQEMDGMATEKSYYLSEQGNDSWEGSKERPFCTFAYALKQLKPGDTLYIRGGIYTEPIDIPENCSGSGKAYITISNYSGEKVVLSGQGENRTLLTVCGASRLCIRGLEFADTKGMDTCAIMVTPGSHHLIISENIIHDINVPNPSMENQCANGILLLGDDAGEGIHNVLLYQNEIYNCQTGWAECISVSANCSNINVVSNILRNIGNIGIDFCGNYGYCSDEAKDFPRDCLAYKNTVNKCISPNATAYGIYVDGGQRIELRENQVMSCSGGIEIGAEEPALLSYATSDIIVRENTIENNEENGITIGGYERNLGWVINVQIHDNICRNNGVDNAIVTLAKCRDVTLQGNTFCNSTGAGAVVYAEFDSGYTKNINFIDNVYSNGNDENDTFFMYLGKSYSSFEEWKRAVGKNVGTYNRKGL